MAVIPFPSVAFIASAVGLYLIVRIITGIISVIKVRKRFRTDAPAPPHSWIWGHMAAIGKYTQGGLYFDTAIEKMWVDLGEPSFMLLDIYPAQKWGMAVLCDMELAEMASHPLPGTSGALYGLHKSQTYQDLVEVVGESSIIMAEDEQWKKIRKQYNPGFNPKYLQSLIPDLIPDIQVFCSKLEAAVDTNITLRNFTTSLTIDIIATVVLGHTIHAQTKESDFTVGFYGMIDWTLARERLNPFHIWNPLRPLATKYYQRKLHRVLDDEIQLGMRNPSELNPRSILSLTMRDEKNRKEQGAEFARLSREQIKTFLLAGYDTTSSMLQWIYYRLSVHPDVLAKMREEFEGIFGSAVNYESYIQEFASQMANGPEAAFRRMHYTMAVIKETLRMHTIAGGVSRKTVVGDGIHATHNGKEYKLDGLFATISMSCIHASKKYWGPDAAEFKPERWLADWKGVRAPAAAFRPFERGPRACMGLDLVYVEARIILAMTVTRYEFTKVFDTEHKTIYSTRKITAKPIDGMRMRVSLVEGQKPLTVKA
ncbi:MAG: hypothetical protein M1814_005516 [Vezdaea aestivalis]|nr:MAG: hypothetical protein M1814_005516 [Vezdaea aestivalis]